jgi:hypothetical protein
MEGSFGDRSPFDVLHWHRKGWRLYWSWRSRTKLGRPRLNNETRDLIARMGRENPRGATERIRGELLKLGFVVSNRSIRRYRWRKPGPADSQVWRTFLANHLKGFWAVDLLVVHIINSGVLYVFFFVSHERRELIHFDVTRRPAAAWIWRQVIEATPWSRQPTHLIHDRDAVYGAGFDSWLSRLGIAGLRTPVRSPKAQPAPGQPRPRFGRQHRRGCVPPGVGGASSRLLSSSLSWTDICRPTASGQCPRERWIGSCRGECPDWMLVPSERQPRRVLSEHVDH